MRRLRHLTRTAAVLIALALTSTADAGKRHQNPDVVDDALAYALTDRSKAIQLLEGALEDEPSPGDLDAITAHAGEQRRLAGDPDEAHRWFSAVLQRTERGPSAQVARMGLALLDAGDGLDARVRGLMEDVSDKDALSTQNADRYLLLAIDAARSNDVGRVTQYSKRALTHAKEDPAVFQRVRSDLEALSADGPPPPEAAGERGTHLERASVALDEGRADDARKLAEQAASRAEAGSEDAAAAAALIQVLDAGPVQTSRIAVLLPLSGKYEAVGRQVRQALEFGYGSTRRQLAFVDSGADPEAAVRALDQAVLDDGAIAVVGPLLSDETDPVVARAQQLRVPLVSLSQSLEDAGPYSFVLQGMYTRKDQVEALVEYAMGEREMDAFAVFAPDNAYGRHATELFVAAVTERQGEVTVSELYDPEATDLLPFAQKLGRKDYDARSAEFYRLKKEAKEKGGKPESVVLPPILDFDGLFLPDNASRVPLACAALAYEEFPMGEFQPTKDSPVIPLLGLSGWNKAALVTTGNLYTRNGVFTDAFAVPSGDDPGWSLDPEDADFVKAYRAEHGRTPSALEATVADLGALLAVAARSPAASRADFRDALLQAQVESAVTGALGFDAETGHAQRTMEVLTLTKDSIIPVRLLPPQ